jgi:hypothetical protein
VSDERHELWLPTSVVKVTVIDGQVTVWDEMTMERKAIKKPAGFAEVKEFGEHFVEHHSKPRAKS